MTPFIAPWLVAAGPWMVPVLLAGLVGLAAVSAWLIESGLATRRYFRFGAGLAIAGYLAAVACAAAGIIR